MQLAKHRAKLTDENGNVAVLTVHDALGALAPLASETQLHPIALLFRELKAIDPLIELHSTGMKLPDGLSFEDWTEVGKVLDRYTGGILRAIEEREGRRRAPRQKSPPPVDVDDNRTADERERDD